MIFLVRSWNGIWIPDRKTHSKCPKGWNDTCVFSLANISRSVSYFDSITSKNSFNNFCDRNLNHLKQSSNLLVLWSTKKYSLIISSSIPKKSKASLKIWQNWTSSPMGNWLGIPPSSGPWGPWTMIFLAEGTLAVRRIEAST